VVGDDAEGKTLLEDFQKVGVDISQIKVKHGAKTGSVLGLSDELGRRSLYVLAGANNLLAMDDLNLNYVNQAKMLHVSSFADDNQFNVLLELMGKLALSVKVSFSPGALYATKGLKALAPILGRSYVLFINQNEIRQLTGKDVVTGAEMCLERGCSIVVVTLGEGTELVLGKETNRSTVTATCYIRDAGGEYLIEPGNRDRVPEGDTTGAGDAFAAGFLYGLLKGKGLKECGILGDIVARFSMTRLGTREGLPTLDKLAQRYPKL